MDWQAWARKAERAIDVAAGGDWKGLFAPGATFSDPNTPSTDDMRQISRDTRTIFPDWTQEITSIRESLINTLIGIYHQRIGYPGFNPPNEAEARSHRAEAGGAPPREGTQDKPTPGDPGPLPQHVRAQSPR